MKLCNTNESKMKLKVLEYIKMLKLGIVTYSFNPRNWKAEAGELAWNID